MKVISIWQPYATLAALGFKHFETRGWPAPRSIIGQRIGLASTKSLKPEQRSGFDDPDFQECYQRLGLPALDDLPRGYLLGTAMLDSIELITEEFLDDVSEEEQLYGWFNLGGYAWRLLDPKPLAHPIPIVGKQGIYDWHGELPDEAQAENQAANSDRQRPKDIRRHLQIV